MVLPSLVGLYIFKEGKNLDRKEQALFLIAIIGGVIIALNFN